MKAKEQHVESDLLTRREVAKIAGMALASGTLLSVLAEGQPASGGTSVFQDSCMPNSAAKYSSGDYPIIYGLAAFWLLLTTENWKTCIEKKGWLDGLSKELGIDKSHLNNLYDICKHNADAFKTVQDAFINYTSDVNVYGARPCPGGSTFVQVAALASKSSARKVRKQ
jgi:hypothetical protein